jgi:hypothetical protein
MKKLLAVLVLVGIALGSQATLILSESFETDGQGTRYNSTTEFLSSDEDYYGRQDNTVTDRSYVNVDGSYWWGGQDQDAPAITTNIFSGISISGYSSLEFSALFAEQRPEASGADDIDSSDFIHVDFQIDGGGWQNLMWWHNDGSSFNTTFLQDTDFNGVGDGAQLETTFSNYTASITGTGNSLDLRFTAQVDSGDEDWAVDNIQVNGVIPEPTTFALFGIALGLIGLIRRR